MHNDLHYFFPLCKVQWISLQDTFPTLFPQYLQSFTWVFCVGHLLSKLQLFPLFILLVVRQYVCIGYILVICLLFSFKNKSVPPEEGHMEFIVIAPVGMWESLIFNWLGLLLRFLLHTRNFKDWEKSIWNFISLGRYYITRDQTTECEQYASLIPFSLSNIKNGSLIGLQLWLMYGLILCHWVIFSRKICSQPGSSNLQMVQAYPCIWVHPPCYWSSFPLSFHLSLH